MARPLGRQSITIQRAALTDDGHGNKTRDWTNPTSTVVAGCNVEPGASTEELLGRDYVLVSFTVMAPITTDITATDRVVYNGVTYDVYGEPGPLYGFTGRLDYVQILLQRRKG